MLPPSWMVFLLSTLFWKWALALCLTITNCCWCWNLNRNLLKMIEKLSIVLSFHFHKFESDFYQSLVGWGQAPQDASTIKYNQAQSSTIKYNQVQSSTAPRLQAQSSTPGTASSHARATLPLPTGAGVGGNLKSTIGYLFYQARYPLYNALMQRPHNIGDEWLEIYFMDSIPFRNRTMEGKTH